MSGDERAIAATNFESLCRSAASDLSNRYFASLPGVRALRAVQANLKWAEEVWSSADRPRTWRAIVHSKEAQTTCTQRAPSRNKERRGGTTMAIRAIGAIRTS